MSASPEQDGARVGTRPIFEAHEIEKNFGQVQALRGASLTLREATVTALVGDNGAGKSTLIRCISGTYKPDAGQFVLDGRPVTIGSVDDARALGIETVYQDLALVNELTVFQNLYLNREQVRSIGPFRFTNRNAMAAQAAQLLKDLQIDVPSVNAKVRELSGGQRQGIAIARGVFWGRRIVILDEPTAALGVKETARVEQLIAGLVERGSTVLMISHSVEQVLRLASHVWVMRSGRVVGGLDAAGATHNDIVSLITGATVGNGAER